MPAAAEPEPPEEIQPPPRVAEAPRQRGPLPKDRQRQARNLEEDWENADLGAPRRREAPPRKGGFDFIAWFSVLLVVGYLTALGLVYFGVVGGTPPAAKYLKQI
jgi:hypothetical protein